MNRSRRVPLNIHIKGLPGKYTSITIYTIKTDLEKSPKHPDMELYRASYDIFKNDDELVLYSEHIQTVKYCQPVNFASK